MKIFLDTIDLKEIKKYKEIFEVEGVTTNPNLARRFGMSNDIEMINRISDVLGPEKEIHVEAFGSTSKEIIDNAQRINKECKNKNLVYKIPFSEYGVQAAKYLISKKFKTNLHLIFSLSQAFIAGSIGSNYICPLVGRLDDIGHDAIKNISSIKKAYEKNNIKTKIMASSIRNSQHVISCFENAIDVITIPLSVIKDLFKHPLTDIGYDNFKKDLHQMKKISDLTFDKNLIIDQSKTLFETVVTLQRCKGGAIAITKNNKLEGIFTTGDLNRLVQKKEKINYEQKISDFMTKEPYTIEITDQVEDVKNLIKKINKGQLVVVDQDKVMGIIDVRDFV